MGKKIFYGLLTIFSIIGVVFIGTNVILYNKIPTKFLSLESKKYTRPKEIEEYLNENAENVKDYLIKSYEVNNDDLSKLKKENVYKEGKSNPFSEYKIINQNTTNSNKNNQNSTNSNNNSSSSSSSNSNSNSSSNSSNKSSTSSSSSSSNSSSSLVEEESDITINTTNDTSIKEKSSDDFTRSNTEKTSK